MTNGLVPTKFRVTNYRNIDDSGWIPVEKVTAFVGRNESGKTTLLKALHKFNPASPEPYNPQREFPRDRFTRDYKNGRDWPVCAIEFDIVPTLQAKLNNVLSTNIPSSVTFTRYYDGTLELSLNEDLQDDKIKSTEFVSALDKCIKAARRVAAPSPDQETATHQARTALIEWAATTRDTVSDLIDLRNPEAIKALLATRKALVAYSNPLIADVVETLSDTVEDLLDRAQTKPLFARLSEVLEKELPVFIYFENYGILDSAVYLPRLIEDLSRTPDDPKIRTINAMFKHVGLDAESIQALGREEATEARRTGNQVTGEMIRRDQDRKELRAVKANSASLDITRRFSEWFHQRRHQIRYDPDGEYFRIWVSDDRRPGVEIELESRSKGFQWFFSFYLIFLVESNEGHRDAVLLLDEPGLNLHPTAQQELISFFERLSQNNVLLYSTHSPFLIDGDHIHRVRPVTEDETGHSHISVDGWPKDRETIFPLQAAAGYAMIKGLFQHRKNVLVEGMTDYLYLHTLDLLCRATDRTALPDDIYITPCGGTKLVGHIASLFLGQKIRPLVLLDGDDAARVRREALLKELYAGTERAVLQLSDVLDITEIEDLIGESVILPLVSEIVQKKIVLNKDDRNNGSLVDQIKSAATRNELTLPDNWKPEVARRFSVKWSREKPSSVSADMLDRAAKLFTAIKERFDEGIAL